MHHEDPGDVVEEDVEAVLNHEEREAEVPLQAHDAVEDLPRELWGDPRRRLIEEQELRLPHERAGHLEELHLPAGDLRGPAPPHPGQLLGGEGLQGLRRELGLLSGPRPRERRLREALPDLAPGRDERVLHHRHPAEESGVLEAPDDAPPEDRVGLEAVDPLPAEPDRPAVRREDAGDHVEEGRLPAPVRPDEADELPFGDPRTDAIDRPQAAEPLLDVLEPEDGVHSPQLPRVPGDVDGSSPKRSCPSCRTTCRAP